MIAIYSCCMEHAQLKAGRVSAELTQVQAAQRLGVSQPYLSQLEKGERPITKELARAAAELYELPPTVLPIPAMFSERFRADPDNLARRLAGLGYPGFSHLRGIRANPAVVLLDALVQNDLEVRLAEALPWVVLTYPDLDWVWLVREAKLRDVQNRLGFVVELAKGLAAARPQGQSAFDRLFVATEQLERSRLAREDTLCRDSMPVGERDWLTVNRSPSAKHWNLLTGLTADQLSYAAR